MHRLGIPLFQAYKWGKGEWVINIWKRQFQIDFRGGEQA